MQKWQCVEDEAGRLKLHKCKGAVRPGSRALSNLVPRTFGPGSETCVCDNNDYTLGLAGRRKKFFKKSKCELSRIETPQMLYTDRGYGDKIPWRMWSQESGSDLLFLKAQSR